jgi:hypothetical protein
VEPIVKKSSTLMVPLTLDNPVRLTALPSRVAFRTLIDEPNCAKARVDIAEPNRAKLRRLTLDPISDHAITDILLIEPIATTPRTLMEEPHREYCRSESELEAMAKSRMDMQLDNRAVDRSERLLPKLANARMDAIEPARIVDRSETVEPI